jgi:hypothetical protein
MHRLRFLILLALPIACAPAAPTPITLPTPTVTAITPSLGSAEGGSAVTIEGSNFLIGSIVRFGGVDVRGSLWEGRLYVTTPPHAAGVVDIEVLIGGGQSGRLANAYTYAPPATLDFSGTWSGWIGESDFVVKFTVEANVVTVVSCGGVNLELATPPTVSNGQFSYTGPGGSITGRILSPLQAKGAVTMPSCVDPFTNEWWAVK